MELEVLKRSGSPKEKVSPACLCMSQFTAAYVCIWLAFYCTELFLFVLALLQAAAMKILPLLENPNQVTLLRSRITLFQHLNVNVNVTCAMSCSCWSPSS